MSSATAQVAPDLFKALAILSLSKDLQLIKKTRNHTGNQTKGHIFRSDQQYYYLQVFQTLY